MLSVRAAILIPALAMGATGAAAEPAKNVERRPAKMSLELKSPAFKAGGRIPKKYTCQGDDVSPPLAWTQAPPGTKSLALIMDDPDAPVGTWVHWVLYDLPATLTSLSEGLPRQEALPDGSKHGKSWGVDDFSRTGYYGPCPPPGHPHRYFFRLYALDRVPGLPTQATKSELLKAMTGHILGQAELMGLYQR